MPTKQLRAAPTAPGAAHSTCGDAFQALVYAHETAAHFLQLFDNPNGQKRAAGAPTDEDQDLLRAMVVFAGAGLDAVLKRLVADALPTLIGKDKAVSKAVQDYVRRRMADNANGDDSPLDCGWPPSPRLLHYLFQTDPRKAFTDELVAKLTARSLQSAKAIKQVIDMFAISLAKWATAEDDIGKALAIRNQIVHEMDVCFTKKVGKRQRQERKRNAMVEHANVLLELAEGILLAIAKKA